jgi:hypothetical protein
MPIWTTGSEVFGPSAPVAEIPKLLTNRVMANSVMTNHLCGRTIDNRSRCRIVIEDFRCD